MRAEKLLNRPRMRFVWVGCEDRLLQREKFFTRSYHKTVVRHRDDVRGFTTGQVEPDGDSARAGESGIVGNKRIGSGIGKADCDRNLPRKMCRPRKSGRFPRGRE